MGDTTQTGGVMVRANLHGRFKPTIDADDLSTAVIYPVVPGRYVSFASGIARDHKRSLYGNTPSTVTVSVFDNTNGQFDRTKAFASYTSTSLDDTIGDLCDGLSNANIESGLTSEGHFFVQTRLGSPLDLKDFIVDVAASAGNGYQFFSLGNQYTPADHGGSYAVRASDVQVGTKRSLKDVLASDLGGIAYPFEIDGNVQFPNGDATTLASLGIPAGTVMNIYGYDHDTADDTPYNETAYNTTLINVTAAMSIGDLKNLLTINTWTVDTSNKTLKMHTTFAPYKRFVNVAAWAALFGTDPFGKALITANNAIPDTCYLPPPIVPLHDYIVGLAARVAALDHGTNP